MKSIWLREKRLGSHVKAQLEEEADMDSIEPVPGSRRHWRSYDSAWHALRDSVQALEIMRESRDQRRLMRTYTAKMLNHRCSILVEAGLLDGADAEAWALERAHELLKSEGGDAKQEAEEEEQEKVVSPKKKKAKKE